MFAACNRKQVGCNWSSSVRANMALLKGKLGLVLNCPSCRKGQIIVRVNKKGPFNKGSAFLGCSEYFKGTCSWNHSMAVNMPIAIDYEANQDTDRSGHQFKSFYPPIESDL